MTTLRREFRTVLAAVAYFTRLPVRIAIGAEDLKAAPRYFAFIGVLVGAAGGATWWLARFVFPNEIAIGLAMVATVLLTGALHEDGLADVCDGFGGGYDREKVLAIMKDSRIGAFGAVGLIFALGLKAITLARIDEGLLMPALICAHAASRWVAGSLLVTHRYVREDAESKARPLTTPQLWRSLIVPTLFGVVPTLLLLPGQCAWVLLLLCLVCWLLGRWFRRRIGGYTGDCIGVTQQVCELSFYLGLVACAV